MDAEDAFRAWQQREQPAPEQVLSLLEWFFTCAADGPPGPDDGAIPVPLQDEPMFSYRVPEIGVVVTYYVVVFERLMLVKEVEGR